jgi:predicted nucleotidyltransferase
MIPNLITENRERIAELCRRYQVRELSLFGSTARGEAGAESDVDLLVEFEPWAEIGFLTLARLQRELSEIVRRPVDLVPKQGLKAAIRQSVLSEAELLYAA